MPARATIPIRPVEVGPSAADLELCGSVVGTVEAARRLNCCKQTLYTLMDSGRLPYVQSGPRCRRGIPERAIAAYLAARLVRKGDDDANLCND